MTCNKCKTPCSEIEVQELAELPIDNLASLPEFILTERTVLDESTGKVLHTLTRTPTQTLIPNGNLANKFTLDPNNPSLNVQANQPLPAYVSNEGTMNVILPADANHPAHFFVTGMVGDLAECQADGVIYTLEGNEYIPGATYYLSNTPGEVTTDATQTGQKLFYCLSNTKLLIEL